MSDHLPLSRWGGGLLSAPHSRVCPPSVRIRPGRQMLPQPVLQERTFYVARGGMHSSNRVSGPPSAVQSLSATPRTTALLSASPPNSICGACWVFGHPWRHEALCVELAGYEWFSMMCIAPTRVWASQEVDFPPCSLAAHPNKSACRARRPRGRARAWHAVECK